MNDPPTLVLGYDGSAGARAAIQAAARLFGGAHVVAVHAWTGIDEHLSLPPLPGMAPALSGGLAELSRAERERAETVAAAGAELARNAGLDAEPLAEEARRPAWKALAHAADRLGADVVVVGSRGRSGAGAALLGSVSRGILHHCHRPVLVVPPGG